MNEEIARTKWCPFVRMGGDTACNRDAQTPMALFYMCIGSDCMMWEAETYYDNNGRPVKNDDGTWKMSDRGDCGLKTKEGVLRE